MCAVTTQHVIILAQGQPLISGIVFVTKALSLTLSKELLPAPVPSSMGVWGGRRIPDCLFCVLDPAVMPASEEGTFVAGAPGRLNISTRSGSNLYVRRRRPSGRLLP
jgi:hypothetical protein